MANDRILCATIIITGWVLLGTRGRKFIIIFRLKNTYNNVTDGTMSTKPEAATRPLQSLHRDQGLRLEGQILGNCCGAVAPWMLWDGIEGT